MMLSGESAETGLQSLLVVANTVLTIVAGRYIHDLIGSVKETVKQVADLKTDVAILKDWRERQEKDNEA